MVLFLREEDTRRLVSMQDAIELVDAALRAKARGEASNLPRVRAQAGKTGLNVLVAAYPAVGYMAVRRVFDRRVGRDELGDALQHGGRAAGSAGGRALAEPGAHRGGDRRGHALPGAG